jgi:hypothetical protein
MSPGGLLCLGPDGRKVRIQQEGERTENAA